MIINVAVAVVSVLLAVWLNTTDGLVEAAFPPIEVATPDRTGSTPNLLKIVLQILLLALAGDQLVRVVRSMGRAGR